MVLTKVLFWIFEILSFRFLALLCATKQQSYCRHAGVRRLSIKPVFSETDKQIDAKFGGKVSFHHSHYISPRPLSDITPVCCGHHLKLFREHSRTEIRHKFFSNRVINTWNSLPASVVSAPTIQAFKDRLELVPL